MTAGLLTLSRWLSPAFPVGGFAYSHGLEAAIAAGAVRDAATLEAWVACVLRHGSGRNDAILLVQAMRPGADLDALAALARAMAAGRERAVEMDETGAAFVRAVAAAGGPRLPDLPQAVAVGAAARGLGLPPATVAALWLQGFAGTLVQAGVRFVPLGQSEGLAVMAALEPVVLAVADEAACATTEDLGGAAFGADLAALDHETLEVRLFRT